MTPHATAILLGLSTFGVVTLSGVAIFWEDISTWWKTRSWPDHLIQVYISETGTTAHIEVVHKKNLIGADLVFNPNSAIRFVVTPAISNDTIKSLLSDVDYFLCWNVKTAYMAPNSLKRVISLLPIDTINVMGIDKYALQLMIDTDKKIRSFSAVYDDPFQLQEALLDMQQQEENAVLGD